MLNMMSWRSLQQQLLQQEMSGNVKYDVNRRCLAKHDVNKRCLAMLNMMSTGDDWQC